jgi:hypothetical protein
MAYQPVNIGAAPNDGTGDPHRDAFDKINDNFVELYAGLVGLLDFKGSTDCSANPNYPAASKGDFYLVSVAGKIGGASGTVVEQGDSYFALADNAGGTQAAVGTSWTVLQGNATGYLPLTGGTLSGDLIVPDEAYDPTNWNGSMEAPTKNAVRDKIETLAAGIPTVSDTAYGVGWNGDTTVAPSKNAVYDKIETLAAGGDVVGPGSSVAGHPAVFDGTTGKLLKDAGVVALANGATITPTATPATNEVGYLGSPVLTGLDSGNVAPALTDCGKTFYHTDANARNFTIPANGSVAFPVGTILVIENGPTAATVSIIITTDVLYWGSSTGTRTLAANGGCTIQKMDSTHWRIRGEGLT